MSSAAPAVSEGISKNLSLGTNYTFTQVDAALDRLIPKHKVNAGIDFQPTGRTFFNVSYQYLDARQDIFYDATVFATMITTLASYQLINATAKYELIANRLTVFGAVTNILNEQFIENVGYSTRGRNFKIGLNIVL